MYYELAALGAALCWAIAALLAGDLSRQLGGITFNRLRNVGVFFVLLIFISLGGLWQALSAQDIWLILLSGLIGVAIGDSFLFSSMKSLGPRRAQILYACNAPITVGLGMILLGERLNLLGMSGVILVFLGVIAAIMWGRPRTAEVIHAWETTEGKLAVGVVFGLMAALGQALGAFIIKPVLDNGINPMLVVTLRVGVSALILTILFYFRNYEAKQSISIRAWTLSTFNGVLAIGIGLSLLMYAFSIGDIGVASILSSTQAVMILPVIWIRTRQRPALGAWVGAILVTIGIAIMFER